MTDYDNTRYKSALEKNLVGVRIGSSRRISESFPRVYRYLLISNAYSI